MEEYLNLFENGRRPKFFSPMQDDLNLFLQMKDNLIFCQMDDNLNLIQMEYDLNSLANGRQPKKKIMQPKTINIKTMVVAPLRVT